MLAKRMSHVTQSPTMKVAAEAERLRRQGVDIVDLGAGEPDFPTPPHIIDAGRRALDAGFTKYTTNVGVEELRAAVCDRYRTDYGVTYSPSDVIITAGGKQALYNATIALFGPGDEVVTHTPGWPTIPEQVKLADATPIIVPTQPADDFCPTADAFLKAFTPRTKGVVINSPGNPTGALMSEEDLAAVADEAAKRGIWILLDLCYERLIYDKVAHNLPGVLAARMRDRAVLCGSMSKTYAMTGWRCGWAVGPTELIKACNAIQSNATSNVNSIAQKASITALTGPQECVTEMLDEYRRRRDTLTAWLAEDTRLRVAKPAGAFYLFVDVGDILSPDGFRTSADLAQGLLDKARVALTPGEAFDAPGYIRLSYAASIERLREGATRILDFVRAHAGAVV
ncbi:MAG TPA: pyridoxal phosphate-dependent aminotransferase [Vicinamibacterales bacterium]|jgi:aspartate aminotransferase|nr:pyridoxal phosphate-dependent aminotransferase [Vicinamibacterales bacterium]